MNPGERFPWFVIAGVLGVSVVAIIIAWVLTARAAAPAEHPCREGLLEWLDKGATTVCYGHLVPPETWAAAQAAVDESTGLKDKVRVLEDQVANLRAQVTETRASGEAKLEVCTNFRLACEAAKQPPKCPEPSLLERGEFAWPTGLGVGFIGGTLFGRWGLGCE